MSREAWRAIAPGGEATGMTVVALLLTCAGLCCGPAGPARIAPGGPWRWPLDPPPRVVRAFEPPARPWAAGHRGVDLAARPGQPVHAAGAGRVTYAARLAGRGVIAVRHARLRTTYLSVRPSVRAGQRVRAGDRIGTVERLPEHCGPRPCLHWGAWDGLSYTDPLALLGGSRTRLLPIWGTPPPGDPGGAARGSGAQYAARPRRRDPAPRTAAPPGERAVRASLAAATAAGGAVATALLLWSAVPPGRRRDPPPTAARGGRVRRGDGPDGRSA
jgi:hypothetical protein